MRLGHRQILWRIQDGKCWLCGGQMLRFGRSNTTPLSASNDHIIPRSMGGGSCIRNKRLAHRRCNSARGNAPPGRDALDRVILTAQVIERYACEYPYIISQPGWDRAVALYCQTIS